MIGAICSPQTGPSPYISWVNIARTLSLSFTYTILGRLSDLFGRRWFFIGGNVVAIVGILVCAVAHNVETLIVGAAIYGLGETVQLSFNVAVGELVPNKYRPVVLSLIFLTNAPISAFGPFVGKSMTRGLYKDSCSLNLSPKVRREPQPQLEMVFLRQHHRRGTRHRSLVPVLPPTHL